MGLQLDGGPGVLPGSAGVRGGPWGLLAGGGPVGADPGGLRVQVVPWCAGAVVGRVAGRVALRRGLA